MTATEKLTKIMEIINSGRTVTFVSGRSAIKVDAKVVSRFTKSGYDVLKVINNELCVLSGKSYKSLRFHAVYSS